MFWTPDEAKFQKGWVVAKKERKYSYKPMTTIITLATFVKEGDVIKVNLSWDMHTVYTDNAR